MFILLQNQALAAIRLALAIVLAAHEPRAVLRLQDLLGATILLVGIAGEALADSQIERFRDDPANKGQVCDRGLWAWSRHPNYFFEWLGWLAYPVIAIDPPGRSPGLASLWRRSSCTGPALRHRRAAAGRAMLASRGERFRAYQARTSVFFPLPPQEPGAAA